MIINLNKNKPPQVENYDLCICGAGVAGISIAIRAGESGKKVAIFEGGDENYSKESQALYAASSTLESYSAASNACRLRYLGGTSNHWAGRCRPFESFDFEHRDYFEMPGWPIAYEELEKYTHEANLVLDLEENQAFESASEPQSWQSDKFVLDRAQMSPPTRFKEKYFDQLVASENIVLFTNANLTDISLDSEHGYVKHLKIENFVDDSYHFSGNQTVLAMGAIENARLLLNSNTQQESGIGNQFDFVGRCFMEHFNVNFGRFATDHEFMQPEQRLGLFSTREFSLEHKIGSSNIRYVVVNNPKSYGRTKFLKKYFSDMVCQSASVTETARQYVNFECPGVGLIGTLTEQSPNRESRVRLSNDVQRFGLRNTVVEYKINELDRRTIRTNALESAKEFARLNFGRVQLSDFVLDKDKEIDFVAHCHQMGTTRMSADPQNGVVDSNCKVFGLENLYIAGSSVFSTGGGNNPTYPLVQLALRLADHLIET